MNHRISPLRLILTAFLMAGLFFASAMFVLMAMAQSLPEAEVEFYIKNRTTEESLTVGDQLTLRLDVIHPHGSRVSLPQVDREWGSFYVIDQTAPKVTEQGNGMATTSKDFVVTIFQPGIYKTPSLAVTHRKPNGEIEDLASPVVQVKYSTVITDSEDLELRDLKGQAYLSEPLIWPFVIGVILFITAILLIVIWLIWRFAIRRTKPPVEVSAEPEPYIDPRPPEVIAYAELDRIASLRLPEQDAFKEHYSLVSECLREYIENRYDLPALEQTTYELNLAMRKSSLPIGHTGSFINLLSESDLVKFAKHIPETDELHNLINRARSIVTLTTPKPTLVPEESPETPSINLEKQP